ncbi:MAG: hypothetical protein HY246_13490 [Proteobacteria bacterium]|nr:hypothetical protein [Pseudomonadota bacterium]
MYFVNVPGAHALGQDDTIPFMLPGIGPLRRHREFRRIVGSHCYTAQLYVLANMACELRLGGACGGDWVADALAGALFIRLMHDAPRSRCIDLGHVRVARRRRGRAGEAEDGEQSEDDRTQHHANSGSNERAGLIIPMVGEERSTVLGQRHGGNIAQWLALSTGVAMSRMDIGELVEGYMREAEIDYVGLWQIPGTIRHCLGIHDDDEVREKSLEVVKGLLERGLYPGTFFYSKFSFWIGLGADLVLAQIEKEWKALKHDPDLLDSICWFTWRKSRRG